MLSRHARSARDSGTSAVRRLALARVVSITGGHAANVAIAFTVFAWTQSAWWLTLSFVLTGGVSGFLSPWAGALSDKVDRKKVMIGSELAGAVTFGLLCFADSTAWLLALACVASIVRLPFNPASAAAIPNLVTKDRLSWANGLVAVGNNIGMTAGPALGGVVLAAIGVDWVFIINAFSFTVSALVIVGIHGTFSRVDTTDEQQSARGALVGLKHILAHRLLRSLFISTALIWLAINSAFVADVPLADILGVGSVGYGLMDTIWGLGAILGAIIVRRVSTSREINFVAIGVAVVAVAYFVIAGSPWFLLILAVMFVAAIFDTIGLVCGENQIQRHTPDAVRARVFGTITGAGYLANVLGFTLAGLLLDVFGPRQIYLVGGVVALAALVALGPAMRAKKSDQGGLQTPSRSVTGLPSERTDELP